MKSLTMLISNSCLVLRFVDKECIIREEFLDFRCTNRITGQVISSLILEKLEQWGLDISNCRGQGYDGASNMSAQAQGVQGLIAQKIPKALPVCALQFPCIESRYSKSM